MRGVQRRREFKAAVKKALCELISTESIKLLLTKSSVTALGITKGTTNDIRELGWTNFRRDTELKHHVRLEGFDAAKIRAPASMALGDIEDCMLAIEQEECFFRKMAPREVYEYGKELKKDGVKTNIRKTRTDSGKKRDVTAAKVSKKKVKNSQRKTEKKKATRRGKKVDSEEEESDMTESSESDEDSTASEIEVCGSGYTPGASNSHNRSRFYLPKQGGSITCPDIVAKASGQWRWMMRMR
jgi:hypothetical protein